MVPSQNVERGFRSEQICCLSQFPDGLHGTVVDVIADAELQGCLMGMGLFVGTRFQLLRSGGTTQNIPFLLATGETRIAIGREIADMILVEY